MSILRILLVSVSLTGFINASVQTIEPIREPVRACVVERDTPLTKLVRQQIEQCLGWVDNPLLLCRGEYTNVEPHAPVEGETVKVLADEVSFYAQGRSALQGNVDIQQADRVATAQTAYIYRDANSKQITKIELLGDVHYTEPSRLMIARRAELNPQDHSGVVESVLYRFSTPQAFAVLPAWGRASLIKRFPNKDYYLEKATYTTCRPQSKAWHIEAKSIKIDNTKNEAVARHAKFYVADVPIFYSPYLSFPTSKDRKSGFLMPTKGYSNVGGYEFSLPYYWNIAPNLDTTVTPHYYSLRGLMLEDEFRYLTGKSSGIFKGTFLPKDSAYKQFLRSNEAAYPYLSESSTDRWSVKVDDVTQLIPNLNFHVSYEQLSDYYYLEDFTTNLAILSQRQILQQGDLSYTTDHWLLRGMLQAYQTLLPINQTPVATIYQRLPQFLASGFYDQLPFNAELTLLGQFDQFHMPNTVPIPEGPRYFLNPQLLLPQVKSWGYLTPGIDLVQNFYTVNHYSTPTNSENFSRTIPRYSLDSGLYFERKGSVFDQACTQTLEPRLYYLNVPYHDQTPIPVYESAYMIFNMDQLFRNNRFSGFDRIGDANQMAYAVTSRWI